jgi:hypothetical protein
MSFSSQRKLLSLATATVAIALAPVLLVAGDSLLRWARDPHAIRSRPARVDGGTAAVVTGRAGGGMMTLPRGLIATSGVIIALGAPQRWIRDRLGRGWRLDRRHWFPPNGNGLAGVREPRRPRPTLPAAHIARQAPGPNEDD